MDYNDFLSGNAIVFEGFLISRTEGRITFQVHPGFTVEVDEKLCESVEEATDEVSGKTYLRLKVSPDADLRATFQLRLARLALSKAAGAVPFTMGGLPEGVEEGPIYLTEAEGSRNLRIGGGGFGVGGGGLGVRGTDTIGEFSTRSRHVIWGWRSDDKTYSDRIPDGGGVIA
jgi:hypothetical protein